MDGEALEGCIKTAIEAFRHRDSHLLLVNANERAMTHKFAEHLQSALGDEWNVDCEYNRDGEIPKALHNLGRQRVRKDDSNADTVFPDIIVHRRGKAGPNLIVIEAKKDAGSDADDHKKIEGYLLEFGYERAGLLRFITGEQFDVTFEWFEAATSLLQ